MPVKRYPRSVLILLSLLVTQLFVSGASAVPGYDVDETSNVWAPYGPYVDRLELRYFASEAAEFLEFQNGGVDVFDWPVNPAFYPSLDSHPDFLLSPPQGEYRMFQIDINHWGGRWQSWGCTNFSAHLDDTDTGCGYHLRAALAHLYDRPAFAQAPPLSGTAVPLADPSPSAKSPFASKLTVQQSWDTLHSTPLGAFNIVNDVGGFATSAASADFCAARDHIVAANIGFVDANSDCVIDNPGVAAANPLRLFSRIDHPPRRELGSRLTNALNSLFGTDVVAGCVIIGCINLLQDIVFEQGTMAAPAYDDWELYTGGWSLGGPFPDHFYGLYHPEFASDFCGGTPDPGFIFNYPLVCSSTLTSLIDRTLATDDPDEFTAITREIFYEFGKRVLNIPGFSLARRDLALRDVAGLVNQRADGFSNFWTMMNGRENPDYAPVYSQYLFGGGDFSKLRWGQRQGTFSLNPFTATTIWENNVLRMVYDPLIRTSPVEPTKIICWMCNSFEKSIDANGDTHFVFELKQTLRFHDGVPETARDVKFSIENFRDIPTHSLGVNVAQVIDVIAHSDTVVEIIFSGKNLEHIYNLGVLIVPRHLWDENNDGLADGCYPVFDGFENKCIMDPLQTLVNGVGLFTGSGPFVCRAVTGVQPTGPVGRGCAPDEVFSPGDNVVLQRFAGYHRGLSQFGEFSWADEDNDGVVGVTDFGEVLLCGSGISGFCSQALLDYWDLDGNGDTAAEAILVAAHLYETWVFPYPWSIDYLSNITPFTA